MNAPWIIAADCNKTPDEVAHSTFVRYLEGVVVAPAVEFTCASAPPPGRVIDMVITCKACVPHLQVKPFYDHPFKPHVVALSIELSLEMDIDMVSAQVVPDEIGYYQGPRNQLDTWELHYNAFEHARADIQAPWSDAANRTITDMYARWSLATESYLLALSPDASAQQMGRASTIAFQQVQANFSNIDSQVYTKPLISIWEHLGTLLRTFRGMLVSGNSTDIHEVMKSIDNMQSGLDAKTPGDSFELVQKLKMHIQKALVEFNVTKTRVAVCTCNDVLAAAIEQHSKATTIEYQKFIVASCAGGASRGHALIKCFERDAGRSYEDIFATSQLEQGIDVSSGWMPEWISGQWPNGIAIGIAEASRLILPWPSLRKPCRRQNRCRGSKSMNSGGFSLPGLPRQGLVLIFGSSRC